MATIRIIFDIKQQYLTLNTRIVLGGHVVESSKHTTYSLNIKDISIRLMLMISVKNGIGLITRDIGNTFCTAACAEPIWYKCVQAFVANFGANVVLNHALYVLETSSYSFHNFFE